MAIELFQFLPLVLIVFLAGLLQSTVGFAYSLFATPLLVWLGLPLPDTITIIATCSTIQSAFASRKLHFAVPWSLVLASAVVRLVTIIAGLILLKLLVSFSNVHIKAVIGGILCLLVIIQLLWKPRPVATVPWWWTGAAWSVSGFLSGICGMGGPPLVLWLLAHNWPTKKTRGFLFAMTLASTPFQVILLCITFGVDMIWNVAIGVALLPVVYLGFRIGLPVGNRLPRTTLRRIALLILLIIGAIAVAQCR